MDWDLYLESNSTSFRISDTLTREWLHHRWSGNIFTKNSWFIFYFLTYRMSSQCWGQRLMGLLFSSCLFSAWQKPAEKISLVMTVLKRPYTRDWRRSIIIKSFFCTYLLLSIRKTLDLFTAAMHFFYSVKKLKHQWRLSHRQRLHKLYSLSTWTLQMNCSLKIQTVFVIRSLQAEKKEITASVTSANMIT